MKVFFDLIDFWKHVKIIRWIPLKLKTILFLAQSTIRRNGGKAWKNQSFTCMWQKFKFNWPVKWLEDWNTYYTKKNYTICVFFFIDINSFFIIWILLWPKIWSKTYIGALSIASMGVQSEINYFYMIIKDDTIRKSIDHLQSLVNQSNKIEPCLTLLNLMLVLLYCLINSFEFYLMVRMQKFN